MPKRSAGILPFKVLPDQSVEVLIVHPGGPFWKNKETTHGRSSRESTTSMNGPSWRRTAKFSEELGLPVPQGRGSIWAKSAVGRKTGSSVGG